MNAKQELLFSELNTARYGDPRRHQNLFIPKLLEKSASTITPTDEFENAYKKICKWAELEACGKLGEKKETSLEAEFITEIFGQALGYKLFTEGGDRWNIYPKYKIDGLEADAALGIFGNSAMALVYALLELKGPRMNLDKDRFNGRTAVQQCWEYLNNLPECPWGIVCNYVSFRLYNRNHTPKRYQLFVLQDLKNKKKFAEFYYLLHSNGIIPSTKFRIPRAQQLLNEIDKQQKEVGDELYRYYDERRSELIGVLIKAPFNKPQEKAIRIAQKLIDRVIFIAFCEDRDFLPKEMLKRAHSQISEFPGVTNPRWENFKNLFRRIDKGDKEKGIPAFNGGLFAIDSEADNLELDDRWAFIFSRIGEWDFRDEVNLDVLGHLFEKSINDIEKLKVGALFNGEIAEEIRPRMEKSAERKKGGIYYTPPEFTAFIAHGVVGKTIDERWEGLLKKHKLTTKDLTDGKRGKKHEFYWLDCLKVLRDIKVVDPACGSGAFLIQAYEVFEERYHEIIDNIEFQSGEKQESLMDAMPDMILRDNIFGVDLSEEAVEITQLALWIRTAREGKTLADLSKNIKVGNSLVDDPQVAARPMDWQAAFPAVFAREESGFDCVIGNPPWERMKLQEREFFDALDPEIASAVNAATRKRLIKELKGNKPEIYARYERAKEAADQALEYIRKCERFPQTGKGDINTYALFAELADNLVSANGHVGLLVPSGIATDHTNKDFFNSIIKRQGLFGLYDFENKGIFPDVDGRFKFCIFLFNGEKLHAKAADFVFFAHHIDDLKDRGRHISLSAGDFKLLNPNTRTCPIFRSRHDAEITKRIYRQVPILVDLNRKEDGNPWGMKFSTMFHQTNDAELFKDADWLVGQGFKLKGNSWVKGKEIYLPLYEAKMIQMYDHRAASVVLRKDNWFRQGQTQETTLVEYQNADFSITPRWWMEKARVSAVANVEKEAGHLAFKNVTSPTNTRTMIAAYVPPVGVINSAPIINFADAISIRQRLCLLANLNSFALDYMARQKIGNVNLNFFLIEQFPMLSPDQYTKRCRWEIRSTWEKWISDRVLKLVCTSKDIIRIAEEANSKELVHKWRPDERVDLMAQLDAAYFILYGIERTDVEYILSTFSGVKERPADLFGNITQYDLILRYYDLYRSKMKG
jgi:hypothetical protein